MGNLPPELSRQLLSIKDPWSLLQRLLGLSDGVSNSTEPMPQGWDQKRPMMLALVNGTSGSTLERINAVIFDGANVPMHVRVIVPAVDSRPLGAALEKALAQQTHDASSGPGRYLLDWNPPNSHLAVAVVPALDHVRLELLYFLHKPHEDKDKLDILAQLERTIVAPQPRTGPTVTEHLVANSHGIVIGFQPSALAREIELTAPTKMMGALMHVDPQVKIRILAEGLAEILEGHLLVSSGKSDIAEAAITVSFEKGIHAQGLAQLTATGQRQLSLLIDSAGTPLQSPADALASVALAFKPGSNIKQTESELGAYLDGITPERFVQVFKAAGSMAWPACFAKPVGVWRKLIGDAPISGSIGDLTELPHDVSFDVLALDARKGPEYRWRALVSSNAASAWSSLARVLADANSDLDAVQQQRSTNGTWISWTHASQPSDASVPSTRRSDVPNGTFGVARVDTAKVASQLEQIAPDLKRRQSWILWLLRYIGPLHSSVRFQGNWLIGEIATGTTFSARSLEAPFSKPVLEYVKPTAGRAALEQATAEVSDLLKAFAQASNGAPLLAEGRAKLKAVLDRAKSDPSTRTEAAALERMLVELASKFGG